MTNALAILLGVHLAATAAMTGLIWFVQIVHYPLFSEVPDQAFVAYENQHTRLTGYVVGPFMAIEGITALAIGAFERDTVGLSLVLLGLLLLAVIHASTIFLQVPAHGRLSRSWDAAVAARLVRTNWIRTVGWSARAVVAVAMIATAS